MSAEETAASHPPGSPERSLPRLAAWFGWGLLVAGLLVLPLSDHLRPASVEPAAPPWLRLLFWSAVGVCGFLVARFRLSGKQQGKAAAGRGERLAVLGVGAAAGTLAYLESATVLSFLGFHGVRAVWPEPVLHWMGLVAAAVGAVLAAVFPARGPRPPSRRPLLGFAGGVLAVLVAATVLWVWVEERAVWHTTAEAPDPVPVPSTVHEVAWTWDPPQDVRLHHVLPTAAGAVVVLGDGVIALDTATGEEAWQYRRPRDRVSANVTPDGATVVLTVQAAGRDGADHRHELLTLEAATGRIRSDVPVPSEPPGGAPHTADVGALTADTWITWSDGASSLAARDLSTGETRWTVDTDPDCQVVTRDSSRWLQTLPDTVLLSHTCHEDAAETGFDALPETEEGTARITALDAGTGEPRWVHEETVPVRQGYLRITTVDHHAHFGPVRSGPGPERSDGSVVVVAKSDGGRLVLDSATGEVLADGVGPAAECGGLSHYTAAAVAVLCPGPEGTLSFEKHDLDGGTVARAETSTRFNIDRDRGLLAGLMVDWTALPGAGVAVWSRGAPGGVTHYEAGVVDWDGDAEVRTITLPDTGWRWWTATLPAPGAVLAYEGENTVVGLR